MQTLYQKLKIFQDINKQRFGRTQKEVIYEKMFKDNLRNYAHNNNIEYKKQFIISPYIVDFYFPLQSLIVEIDEYHHNKKENQDARREQYLMSLGIIVMRYKIGKEKLQMLEYIEDMLKIFPKKIPSYRKFVRENISLANRFYQNPTEKRRFDSINQIKFTIIDEKINLKWKKITSPCPAKLAVLPSPCALTLRGRGAFNFFQGD